MNNSNNNQVLFIKAILNELVKDKIKSSSDLINKKDQQVDIFINNSNELFNKKIQYIDIVNEIIQDEINKKLEDINPNEKIKKWLMNK